MAADRPPWQRTYAIALCAVIGGTLTYALCDWGQWTRLHVNPYGGVWFWRSGPTASIPINYFGTILWGLSGALAGAGAGTVATAVWRAPLPRALQQVGAAWALTAALLAGTYYLWHLWPF